MFVKQLRVEALFVFELGDDFFERDVDVGRRRQLDDDDSGREAETCRVSSSGIGSDPDRK